MADLWQRTRESFWFYPALLAAVAVLGAEGLVALDRHLELTGTSGSPLLTGLSASGSRALLSAIATSVLTVAGTTFSITISVLATTTSTYGPRLVRNFMSDRGNQLVLGVFTAAFLYALLVLRSVRAETDGAAAFVPTVAVGVAVLLAVATVGCLVYFIHHIADSVQVSTLQHRVRRDLDAVLDAVAPREPGTSSVALVPPLPAVREVVRATSTGYVRWIDLAGLVDVARAADVVVDVVARPGTHLVPGEVLASLRADDDVEDGRADHTSAVRRCFSVGSERVPHQDLEFAVRQLTEMAVRALSPGTNDPYTAASAFDLLGGGLTELASRPAPAPGRADPDGALRVVVPWASFEEVLRSVFQAVRLYAVDAPVALDAAIRLAERLAASARRPAARSAVGEEVARLLDALARAELPDVDRDAARARLGRIIGDAAA